ncbi:PIG-L deacetylase family protein [Salinibius halmophilus]|uniref:PIG-L deacetylase family protein n=1 Tax=Salinibius halmophilus TaxID=1853216 RepID=UPI000E664B53|nr:PIG-L family deacetylase [Salinibius halmophilus]
MKIVVLAAQPGEDIRYLGGSLAKWAAQGADIHIAYYSLGESKAQNESLQLLAQSKRAVKVLGVNPENLHVLDQQVDDVTPNSMASAIQNLLTDLQPQRLILPPTNSRSHASRLLLSAAEMALHPVCTIAQVLHMQGQLWRVDISEHLLDKQDAMTAFDIEPHYFPHPYSPEAIEVNAQATGSHVNLLAAEGFDIWQVIEA